MCTSSTSRKWGYSSDSASTKTMITFRSVRSREKLVLVSAVAPSQIHRVLLRFIWINFCSTRSSISCLTLWLAFQRRIALARSSIRYLTFSFSLVFLFAAWEGPHHPRNLLLGVVYTAKVSPYQTHLMCGLQVWIIPTQIQIHAPALNYTQSRLSRNRAVLAFVLPHFVECRFIGESPKIWFNSVLESRAKVTNGLKVFV